MASGEKKGKQDTPEAATAAFASFDALYIFVGNKKIYSFFSAWSSKKDTPPYPMKDEFMGWGM
jgi:hypothetical protein